jgi:pyridoxine/pyridoxamine 5'-phosphate oxidase
MIITTDSSPEEIKDNISTAFQKAAKDTHHPLRFFTVSTFNNQTSYPASRMVVLRAFLPNWTLRFYTDYRSSKVHQIKNHPSVSLLFWNAEQRYQIRVLGSTAIHYQNEVSEKEWQHITGSAQNAYTTSLAPGSEITKPEDMQFLKDNTHYFSVIDVLPVTVKVLQLNRSEHLAMEFKRQSADQKWSGKWIVP